jgi:hypothetical protein
VQLNGSNRLNGPIAADGTFDIPHVRRGSYQITVNAAPGAAPAAISVGNADVGGIELTVPRLVPVAGSVSAENGATSPRLTIGIDSLNYRTNVTPLVDGTFRTELPEGRYHFGLSLPAGYYLKSMESGKTDLQTDFLQISSNDSVVAVKIALGASPGVRVTGHVTVSGPGPSSSSMKALTLQGCATNETAEASIASDGSFELTKVVPGIYTARVTLASRLTSPAVSLTVPNRDVRNLAVEIPPEVEVRGRVEVDGYGTPPRFSLALIGGETQLEAGKTGSLPAFPTGSLFEAAISGKGVELVQMNVNALPDGSFMMKLPEGTYRVVAANGPNGIPPAYVLRSMTYGSADLFSEPMKVSSERSPELAIGFGTATPDSWASVSGKVRGFDPANGLYRVALESRITSAVETPVAPDGSFEFPRVLKRNTFTARLVPADDAASSPAVAVADKDVTGVEILVPAQKEVRVVASMEDNGPVPVFVMSLAGSGSIVTVLGKPARDGSFTAKLPMDERKVQINGFPLGYKVGAVTYRDADVLKQPLKISKDDADELHVAFAADPSLPFRSLRGQITGPDPQASGMRLSLQGVTSFSTYETDIGSDGSFSISNIPQGAYMPVLLGGAAPSLLSPSTVVVSGSDVFSVQLAATSQTVSLERSFTDDEPAGVTLSSFAGSRQAANESSAVAQLRTINTAELLYMSSHGGSYGTIPEMVKEGLLDARFNSPISGFSWSVIAAGSNYVATAVPESQSTGRFGYFALPDAIIRYSMPQFLSPQGQFASRYHSEPLRHRALDRNRFIRERLEPI